MKEFREYFEGNQLKFKKSKVLVEDETSILNEEETANSELFAHTKTA